MNLAKLLGVKIKRRRRQAITWPPPAMPVHPWLILVVGRRGYGKSYYAAQVLRAWDEADGLTYAVDPVTPDPPPPDYPAHWAQLWAPAPPPELRPGVGLLVVDEADRYLPTAQGARDSLLQDLVLRGRHRGTSLLLCTQRPALVGYDVRSQANRIVIFRLTADEDIKSIVAVCPELRGREDEIRSLPVGRAVVWDDKSGVWPAPAESNLDAVTEKA
jgi:hypothetical protein